MWCFPFKVSVVKFWLPSLCLCGLDTEYPSVTLLDAMFIDIMLMDPTWLSSVLNDLCVLLTFHI